VLDKNHRRETHFWQCRKLATHTAAAIIDGFYKAVCEPFSGLELKDMLTEKELAQKTEIYLADGARVTFSELSWGPGPLVNNRPLA
jgi:hypothetical protein